MSLIALIGILPSVLILAYFHGAPGKDEWTKIEKIGIPLNILFIFCILVVGYKGNWWFKKVPELPITKVALNAEKTRIFIPYLGSRNELLTFLNHEFVISHYIEEFGQGNENPDDNTISPLSANEIKELNNELITRVKSKLV